MQLTETVHVVGSGQNGFSLTDPLDCHVYLLDGGSELALIDAGAGRNVPAIVAQIVAAGFAPSDVAKIFITHLHLDHAGGAAELQRVCGAEVVASQDVTRWLMEGNEEAASLVSSRQAGGYPGGSRLAPVASAAAADAGAAFDVGAISVKVVKADGHSQGHVAYLVDDGRRRVGGARGAGQANGSQGGAQSADSPGPALFSGDALFFGGRILLQNIWDCSLEESIATVRRFAELEFTQFFPGHATFSLHDGKRHVDAAMAHVERLLPPPQLET